MWTSRSPFPYSEIKTHTREEEVAQLQDDHKTCVMLWHRRIFGVVHVGEGRREKRPVFETSSLTNAWQSRSAINDVEGHAKLSKFVVTITSRLRGFYVNCTEFTVTVIVQIRRLYSAWWKSLSPNLLFWMWSHQTECERSDPNKKYRTCFRQCYRGRE